MRLYATILLLAGAASARNVEKGSRYEKRVGIMEAKQAANAAANAAALVAAEKAAANAAAKAEEMALAKQAKAEAMAVEAAKAQAAKVAAAKAKAAAKGQAKKAAKAQTKEENAAAMALAKEAQAARDHVAGGSMINARSMGASNMGGGSAKPKKWTPCGDTISTVSTVKPDKPQTNLNKCLTNDGYEYDVIKCVNWQDSGAMSSAMSSSNNEDKCAIRCHEIFNQHAELPMHIFYCKN